MQSSVEILLQDSRIWRGSDWQLTARPGLPSGFGELDALLPGHGWPRGSVIELQHDSHGLGEVRLLWPALAQLSAQAREVALVNPPWLPYAPAWRAAGVDLQQLLWLRSNGDEQRLWAFEQCLRSGACGGALLWLELEVAPPAPAVARRLPSRLTASAPRISLPWTNSRSGASGLSTAQR